MIVEWDVEELAALAPAVFDVREALGFYPATWESLPVRLLCAVRELDELEQALEAGSPSEVNLELADVAMYLLTTTIDLWPHRWGKRHVGRHPARRHALPESHTKPARRRITDAFEAWRRNDTNDAGICVELALLETMRLAATLGVHLPTAIAVKLDELRTRTARNGGKNPTS